MEVFSVVVADSGVIPAGAMAIGPFSAGGISEIALMPTTPAVINAVFDATGARITSLPAKPEKVMAGLRRRP